MDYLRPKVGLRRARAAIMLKNMPFFFTFFEGYIQVQVTKVGENEHRAPCLKPASCFGDWLWKTHSVRSTHSVYLCFPSLARPPRSPFPPCEDIRQFGLRTSDYANCFSVVEPICPHYDKTMCKRSCSLSQTGVGYVNGCYAHVACFCCVFQKQFFLAMKKKTGWGVAIPILPSFLMLLCCCNQLLLASFRHFTA